MLALESEVPAFRMIESFRIFLEGFMKLPIAIVSGLLLFVISTFGIVALATRAAMPQAVDPSAPLCPQPAAVVADSREIP